MLRSMTTVLILSLLANPVARAADAVERILDDGIESAMQIYHRDDLAP